MLQIRLFGQPQIRSNETAIFLAPARALALLTYLLLHRDERLARNALAFTFWPDNAESEALAKLREHLRRLREGMPPSEEPWLLTDARTVRWNPNAPVWLDVAEYEQLAANPATTGEAVELYSDDLANRIDEDWLRGPRERFREKQTALLLSLIDSLRARGDRAGAMGYAQRLARHDPLREDGVRALIELRHEMGDRATALQGFRDFTKRLQEELGVEPMPETIAAYERVKAGSEVQTRHNFPASLTTFVGREYEFEMLQTLLMKRRLVTLVGTGGVGKTRLANEAARTMVDHFADGAWLVELASLGDPDLIISAIAHTLGLQNATEASLLTMLQSKHILLVLDNCEHVTRRGGEAPAERLLNGCPRLHVLATSREPLRASGERTERVASLGLPSSDDIRVLSLDELQRSSARCGCSSIGQPTSHRHPSSSAARKPIAGPWPRSPNSTSMESPCHRISLQHIRAGQLEPEGARATRLDDRFALLTAGRRTAHASPANPSRHVGLELRASHTG